MGRTGRFFAFEHHGVTPDVTALAKALGGSKTAMAAMIARKEVFMKAYGTRRRRSSMRRHLRRHGRGLRHRHRGAQHPL